jgi:tetratricopeptide (TPR) repeat protein
MAMNMMQLLRVAKRLNQAAGYLELGMPQQALDSLERLGPAGPFDAEIEYLRGHALRLQHRYREAARRFRLAAEKLPPQDDDAAWLALNAIYNQVGSGFHPIETPGRAERGNRPHRGFRGAAS